MQAVILAAGLGTRMRPLTLNRPKPMLKLAGKPILENTIEQLPTEIDRVVLVVGYLQEQIRNYFGDSFKGRPVSYVHQVQLKGTYHALALAAARLDDCFLVLMGDDVYSKQDLAGLLKFDQSILVTKMEGSLERFGVCREKDGLLCGLLEKQPCVDFNYVNCGAYKLARDIFQEPIAVGPNGEEILSTMVGNLSMKRPIHLVQATRWLPIASPQDLAAAEKILQM